MSTLPKSGQKEADQGQGVAKLAGQIASKEQALARFEDDLKKAEGEEAGAKKQLAEKKAQLADVQKKYDQNVMLLMSAPPLHEAQEKVRRIEIALAENEKELKLIQIRARDSQDRLFAAQSDRAMKQGVLTNKKFMLQQTDKNLNSGGYQAMEAEIRMLESDLTRNEANFRRFEDDSKKFDSRLFDLEMQVKQLKQKERTAQQELIVAKRFDYISTENQRYLVQMNEMEAAIPKIEEDLKKVQKSITKLQERAKIARVELDSDGASLTTLKRDKAA